MLKKQFQKMVVYFVPKQKVYSYGFPIGILLKASDIKGKKYLTIAVTNEAIKDEKNTAIVYHVPVKDVIGIQRATTPFKRWLYGKILHKPLPKYKLKVLVD